MEYIKKFTQYLDTIEVVTPHGMSMECAPHRNPERECQINRIVIKAHPFQVSGLLDCVNDAFGPSTSTLKTQKGNNVRENVPIIQLTNITMETRLSRETQKRLKK